VKRKPTPRKKTLRRAGKTVVGRAASGLPVGYGDLLDQLKTRVRAAQIKAAVAANQELIQLYWDIGRLIVDRQQREGWGQSVIERLAIDLQRSFPGLKGFSPSNVSRMRAFYLAYAPSSGHPSQAVAELGARNSAQAVPKMKRNISAQPVPKLPATDPPPEVAAIPWGHNVLLLFKLSNYAERLWYAEQTIAHGWSRAVLTVQIETDLYRRQGKAVTNFAKTLPALQSDLAQQTIKDPYVFDFLTIGDEARERELETGLLAHIEKFLVELGVGFAFVGRQVSVHVGDDDFHIDLLFYHLKLRAFIVIDLKMEPFQAEFAGKMNFYLSAVDDQMRHPDDQPSIGLILCKRRNRIIAEYALRDMSKPIGVSEWQAKLVQSLPAHLRGSLPTIEEIEAELTPKPRRKPRKK
jgi:predicted nuclease of restriction endonuclease-like (RecB) superfamily